LIQIVRVARRLKRPLGHCLDQLRQWEAMGIKLPAVTPQQIRELHHLTFRHRDLVVLSRHFDGKPPWIVSPVQVAHIVAAATHIAEPITNTVRRLRRLKPLGIQFPDVAEGTNLEFVASRADLVRLSRNLDGRWPWV
jgi:hypothetical protein